MDEFLEGRAKGKTIVGCYSIEEMVANLEKPCRIQLMVKAGEVVDQFIEQVIPHLSAGDIIIDGGNRCAATAALPRLPWLTPQLCAWLTPLQQLERHRPTHRVSQRERHFVPRNWRQRRRGGRAYGAVHHARWQVIEPVFGSGLVLWRRVVVPPPAVTSCVIRTEAWPFVKDIFQSICAKEAKTGAPCCDWVGSGGSGHYTKMVHNGIEYGDMQLCAEAYFLLKHIGRYDNDKIHECFTKCAPRSRSNACRVPHAAHALACRWKTGDLDSFLIEITADIFAYHPPTIPHPPPSPPLSFKGEGADGKEHLVDYILDAAGQKGTGKWTSMNAADLGVPLTLVSEAVFARCVSSLVDERRCVRA